MYTLSIEWIYNVIVQFTQDYCKFQLSDLLILIILDLIWTMYRQHHKHKVETFIFSLVCLHTHTTHIHVALAVCEQF